MAKIERWKRCMKCGQVEPHAGDRNGYDSEKGGAQWKQDKCEGCGYEGIALGDDVVAPDGSLLVNHGEVLSRDIVGCDETATRVLSRKS